MFNKLFAISTIIYFTVNCDVFASEFMHPKFNMKFKTNPINQNELNSKYYLNMGKEFVERQIKNQWNVNRNIAKNVILFLGDGMSMPTLAATRMYMGGEEKMLSFEQFPFVGMSKTYCVDEQIPDSACTATAYLSGVKGNFGTIGVNGKVKKHDCNAGPDNKSKYTESIGKWAYEAGKSIGLVTTTRVTHASPAGLYAHTANRAWESNIDIFDSNCSDINNMDIAKQLVFGDVGSKLKVIFGGGRQEFRDESMLDEEGYPGRRTDRRDLIYEWLHNKSIFENKTYVWNKDGLNNITVDTADAVLGLFDSSNCKYNSEIEGISDVEPTLTEMTTKAIEILSKNKNGFFLFVEGGRIDMAHHDNRAHIALDETVQFSKAIENSLSMVNSNETLIVVTADHAHTMSYSGYGFRGSNIFGTGGRSDIDHVPYLKLSYANGLGYHHSHKVAAGRPDPSTMNLHNMDFEFPATIPRQLETHGGDDVAVYSSGPFAHLFRGIFEQNVIPHIMAYAACIGNGLKACD